jgi:hypothetical protein
MTDPQRGGKMSGSIEVTDLDFVGFDPVPSHVVISFKLDKEANELSLVLRMPSSVANNLSKRIAELIAAPKAGLP